MNKWTSTKRLALCTGALLTLATALAADPNTTPQVVTSEQPAAAPSTAVAPAVSGAAPAKLPYGVDDVLKLSRAQISEDIIQNYIQNSGTIYSLSPNDIVYLRNQGVSDRIVNAMLDQRKRVTEATAQTTPAPAPAGVPAQAPVAAPTYADAATAAAAPTYNYAQPAPVEAPSASPSTVYVIPYPQATAAYYDYPYPSYYGGYWGGYCGPVVSLGFGYGPGWGHGWGYGGWHGGYYHGGYRGGYHGGWHGHH